MLHMYALVRRPAVVPDVTGIADAPLRALGAGDGIDAIVSVTESGGAGATEEAILAHARVVDAVAAANESVLPARFTSDVDAEEELREKLLERRERVLEALDHVRGCVELGLRVLPVAAEEPAEPASGSEYMRRRLDEVTRAQQLARTLHDSLAGAARDSTCNVVARRDIVLTGTYLVARDELDRFGAILDQAERELEGVTLLSTGPWPPYSFALLDPEDR
jgi:hypothetical protein